MQAHSSQPDPIGHPDSALTAAELDRAWEMMASLNAKENWQQLIDGGVEVSLGLLSYEDGSYTPKEKAFAPNIPLPLTPEEAVELAQRLDARLEAAADADQNALIEYGQMRQLLPVMFAFLTEFGRRHGYEPYHGTDYLPLPGELERGLSAFESMVDIGVNVGLLQTEMARRRNDHTEAILDLQEQYEDATLEAFDALPAALRACIEGESKATS